MGNVIVPYLPSIDSPKEPDIVFYEAMIIPKGTKARQGKQDSSSTKIPGKLLWPELLSRHNQVLL